MQIVNDDSQPEAPPSLRFKPASDLPRFLDVENRSQRIVAIVPSGMTRTVTGFDGKPTDAPVARFVITLGLPDLGDRFQYHIEEDVVITHTRIVRRIHDDPHEGFIGQLFQDGNAWDMRALDDDLHSKVEFNIQTLNENGQLVRSPKTLAQMKAEQS